MYFLFKFNRKINQFLQYTCTMNECFCLQRQFLDISVKERQIGRIRGGMEEAAWS